MHEAVARGEVDVAALRRGQHLDAAVGALDRVTSPGAPAPPPSTPGRRELDAVAAHGELGVVEQLDRRSRCRARRATARRRRSRGAGRERRTTNGYCASSGSICGITDRPPRK